MAQPKRILYVEDNPHNRRLVRRALEVRGYQILEAADGLSGIRMATENLPDLVLMDMDIPGLNGFEATTRLRSMAETRAIPIVALTASVAREDRERCLAAGCNGFISKPISIQELQEKVASFLAGEVEHVAESRKGALLEEYSQQLVVRLEGQIQELQKAHAALAKIDRLKSDFLVLASHELRTPLTVIKGYSSLLTSDMATLEPQYQMMLAAIARGAQQLSTVVDEMLTVSELETGNVEIHPEALNLSVLSQGVTETMRRRSDEAGRTVAVLFVSNPPEIMIHGDGARLQRAIESLVHNALKYTPDGGRVTVEVTRFNSPQGQANSRYPGQTHFVDVCVIDSGIGVPLDEQELIFEKFYVSEDTDYHSTHQTAFMGGGVGLGLAIVKGTAEAHGGRVWVESPGRDRTRLPGSRFHLLIPAGGGPKLPTPETHQPDPTPSIHE